MTNNQGHRSGGGRLGGDDREPQGWPGAGAVQYNKYIIISTYIIM